MKQLNTDLNMEFTTPNQTLVATCRDWKINLSKINRTQSHINCRAYGKHIRATTLKLATIVAFSERSLYDAKIHCFAFASMSAIENFYRIERPAVCHNPSDLFQSSSHDWSLEKVLPEEQFLSYRKIDIKDKLINCLTVPLPH